MNIPRRNGFSLYRRIANSEWRMEKLPPLPYSLFATSLFATRHPIFARSRYLLHRLGIEPEQPGGGAAKNVAAAGLAEGRQVVGHASPVENPMPVGRRPHQLRP